MMTDKARFKGGTAPKQVSVQELASQELPRRRFRALNAQERIKQILEARRQFREEQLRREEEERLRREEEERLRREEEERRYQREVESVTPELLRELEAAGIKNIKQKERVEAYKILEERGYSAEAIRRIMDKYGPQFKVYGSHSPGLLASAERKEAAKARGLPSTATWKQIVPEGGSVTLVKVENDRVQEKITFTRGEEGEIIRTSTKFERTAPTSQPSLSQKISDLESTPLEEPPVQDNRGIIKKAYHKIVDFISGQTGGVWLEHLERPTGMNSTEIKQELKQSTTKGLLNSILFGIPGLGFGNVQSEWSKSAEKIRQSGISTTLKQEEQVKNIEIVSGEIEKATIEYQGGLTGEDMIDLAFGRKTYDEILKEKIKAPGIQAKILKKEIEAYQQKVESFNKQFGGGELTPDNYKLALKEKIELETERKKLLEKQESLIKAQESYESEIVSKVAKLRTVGVETKIDSQGSLVFDSKALNTVVAPVGMKLQKDFMKEDKLTLKNLVYGGGAVVHSAAEMATLGFLTGGTGAIASVGATITKLPKAAQVGITALGIGGAVSGIASKGYSGYKLSSQVGVPGWYGATIGTVTGIGDVAGFMAGGYYGTKAYYSGVQDKIISGKYTKSIEEVRSGKLKVDLKTGTVKGGSAKQMGIYETKIKGTEWKIKSGVKMEGIYGKDSGMSSVKISSRFQGKAPRGMPKSWITEGQTLESDDAIRLRAFTKPIKGKTWYQQDFLMKRTMLDKLKLDVSKEPAFKGYSELERLKFLTEMKAVGKPVKVGEVAPNKIKDIWKSEELFRFSQYKGQGKVMQPWEFGEAKADSLFGTKQYILYKNIKPQSTTLETSGGTIKVLSTDTGLKEFQSIGESRGISMELLKQQIKDRILVIKSGLANMIGGKRGQSTIIKPSPSTKPPTISKTYVPQVTNPTTLIDTVQLSEPVLESISKQVSDLKTSTLLFGTATAGAKQFIETKQDSGKQSLSQKTTPRIAERQLTAELTTPSTATTTRTATTTITTPTTISRTGTSTKTMPAASQITQQITTPTLITPSISPPVTIPPRPPLLPPLIPFFKMAKTPSSEKGVYNVQVRRQGIFKNIGKSSSLEKAFALGSQKVGKTLAASFRIKGVKILPSIFKLPKEFYQKKGKELTFIEKRKYRLNTPGELKEIKLAKLSKGKIKL